MKKEISTVLLSAALVACGGSGGSSDPTPPLLPKPGIHFTTFESGQVRPMAMSSDNSKLLVTNTPNSTLEIFNIDSSGLSHQQSVPVGLEPVAVAVADNQAWVVNHLSDSISIVDLSSTPARVIQTLLVGDEPRDIVFAGDNKSRAFISTAHRGQNGPDDNAIDAGLTTPGLGRADIWVFDRRQPGTSIGGDPITVVNLYSDSPRSLAVSQDGNTVYAAGFLSGNKTTVLGESKLDKSLPTTNAEGFEQPDTGLIVRFDGNNWRDDNGTDWSNRVNLSLPDYDVFSINAAGNPPQEIPTQRHSGVGTVLYNMIINPVSGALYVTNTEARNQVRFEGTRAAGSQISSVRGHFSESRITVITSSGNVIPRHLNKHIDYTQNSNPQLKQASISQPMGMAISSDGTSLYVTGFGSQKISVYNTSQLEDNSFDPTAVRQINLNAGGPSGLILDKSRNRLYVLTRFNNGLVTIDTTNHDQVQQLTMYNPEPESVINGRPFLYDANLSSAHGDSSCGLCHVFGDFDGLAWDLGDPDANRIANPNPFVNDQNLQITNPVFHPMKGPMSTQSLRGLKGNGPMHWRGDRTGKAGNNNDSLELRAFMDFNPAFVGLVGNNNELPEEQMRAFAEFALQISYPPNPIRALDNSLNATQAQGRNIYINQRTSGLTPIQLGGGALFTCNTCHVLNPGSGQFGTGGLSTIEGPEISQQFKVPHLRNLYQKVGMFGNTSDFNSGDQFMGDQIKGFGFMHDGSMDTLEHFLGGSVFRFDFNSDTENNRKRAAVVDFLMAMDSELAPIVGQQITLNSNSSSASRTRAELLRQRALVFQPRQECELVVNGIIGGLARGAVLRSDGLYQTDRSEQTLTHEELLNIANQDGQDITFTCVPPGSGVWMGVDRDGDGHYNRDEMDQGTDPLSPAP